MNLTGVIITHNEEKNIERCLQSIQGLADDIVVVDSFSTDRTRELCEKYNVRFFEREWEGYSAAKNFGNAQAKNEWVLSLDADEALSPELRNEILQEMRNPAAEAYALKFRTIFCGKKLSFGRWSKEYHVRLFNKNRIRWNEAEVHEGLIIPANCKIKKLRHPVYHYTVHTVAEHRNKIHSYSRLAAEKMYRKGKKPSLMKMYLKPPLKFFSDYFLKLGFLDGYYGFVYHKNSAWSRYLREKKLQEIYKKK